MMASQLHALKRTACVAIDTARKALNTVSQRLWHDPELAYQEHRSHDLLAQFLEDYGFKVDRKYKLDTAFRAMIGAGRPHVVVICEYDALPEIGHACGHNLIAEVGVAAGVGLKAALDSVDTIPGTVTILGTPAEEGGGGKLELIKRGAFEDADIAMMSHPFPYNIVEALVVATTRVTVTFRGKASHAAAFPWEGVNALDAAVMSYNSLSCLRQQMKPDCRIHGVITNGGAKPNIIPEVSELAYQFRAPTQDELDSLVKRAVACFEGAAKGTGCQVEYKWTDRPYTHMITNKPLAGAYVNNISTLGINYKLPDAEKQRIRQAAVSTDMGNLSAKVPSIHPWFNINTTAFNHTRQFADDAAAEEAQPFTLAQGKALAMTALDVLYEPDLVKAIQEDFQTAS